MLSEMNTIGMVAKHWLVTPRTVRNRIKSGALPCLRLGGTVRLTRQQVEGYEATCICGGTQTARSTSDMVGAASPLRRAIAGKLNSSSPALSHSTAVHRESNIRLGKYLEATQPTKP